MGQAIMIQSLTTTITAWNLALGLIISMTVTNKASGG